MFSPYFAILSNSTFSGQVPTQKHI